MNLLYRLPQAYKQAIVDAYQRDDYEEAAKLLDVKRTTAYMPLFDDGRSSRESSRDKKEDSAMIICATRSFESSTNIRPSH